MRERGKALEAADHDFNYSELIPCKKHPHSSSVGICPHCLKDRLVNLVCSDCGEQRLSSCSCSDVSSSYRNSCSTAEVGSVGRVSFLIDTEKDKDHAKPRKEDKTEQVIFLRRSNSSCVEVKKTNGFWKIKRLFRKKRNRGFSDHEVWVSDIMGVSRSRSLCSFRNGGRNDLDEECAMSSAKISDVTSGIFFAESEPRRSGFRGLFDSDNGGGGGRKSGSSHALVELDRTYSVQDSGVFPAKESDFNAMDESAFIDLKLDEVSDHGLVCKNESFDDGGNGGFDSCRGLKRSGNSKKHKVWKWIFKYHPGNSHKKEENDILNS